MLSLGGLSPPKQMKVLRRGLSPLEINPALEKWSLNIPGGQIGMRLYNSNVNGWHLISKVKRRWPSMSIPTPNREIDEVRNSEKLVLHDDTEHCMLVLAVLGNQKILFSK